MMQEPLVVPQWRSSNLDKPDLQMRSVPFVEPKTPDWGRVAQICSLSERERRWANFGPVEGVLSQVIQEITSLGNDQCAVPSSSATTALHAVVGLHAITAGRPLNWAVSAFGFASSVIGPLCDRALVVDCDSSGMIDLEQLEGVDPERWDGMIVTNIFGIASDLSRFEDFSRRKGKPLVIDSALAFPLPRHRSETVTEVISFHHTKPWGFGEGGCAIVPRKHAAIIRSLLNFGTNLDGIALGYAMNGKLSDAAAALIIDRLERLPSWAPLYAAQRHRVASAAAHAGLALLGTPPLETIVAHLAVLARKPLTINELPTARFTTGKYYRPLEQGCPTSRKIFDCIINVPCHSAMAAISDSELAAFFDSVA
jgi:dTDP-4-amino-4,6-dideoxygalactose transaminase